MLEFTFVAELENGQIITQHPDDVSRLDPKKRSSFYDVVNAGNPVKRFSLTGKGHLLTVDLTYGHIEVDGRKVYPPKSPPAKVPLELIYYRQVQQRMVVTYETRPDGVQEEKQLLLPLTRYYIGWKCNYNGKPYKFELGVD